MSAEIWHVRLSAVSDETAPVFPENLDMLNS
jgi:hypothetical protein